jgi:hypothetical protein
LKTAEPFLFRADEVIEQVGDFRLWRFASLRGDAAIRPRSETGALIAIASHPAP